jgi:hypothetical protein
MPRRFVSAVLASAQSIDGAAFVQFWRERDQLVKLMRKVR